MGHLLICDSNIAIRVGGEGNKFEKDEQALVCLLL